VSPYDFPRLETLVKKIVNEKQPFERLEMKKEDLLKMFEVCDHCTYFDAVDTVCMVFSLLTVFEFKIHSVKKFK